MSYFPNYESADRLKGDKIAKLLRGSWRTSVVDKIAGDTDLRSVAPRLFQSSCGPLVWWRLRDTSFANNGTLHRFQEAYRLSRLSARIHEQEICHIFARLRDAGIDPVLVKGWAIGRKYPEPALRPYGDIDICVRPDQYEDAKRALEYFEGLDGHYFDLHQGIDSVGRGNLERPVSEARALARATLQLGLLRSKDALPHGRASDTWDDVFARTQLVPLGDAPSSLEEGNGARVAHTMVRVLSDEDHLRVLCHHFLLSGAWRPLWLVDVAVALETASEDFNWDICLGRNPIHANWVKCVVALARELLRAEVRSQRSEISPDSRLLTHVSPQWLTAAVLRQWGRSQNPSTVKGTLPTLMKLRSQPRELIREIYARWDHPIRSTASLNGRFNNWPRAPYQVIDQLKRVRAELPKQVRIIWKATRGSGSQFTIRNPQFD